MITVIGLGFVGLTTALGFSEKGFKVYGVDSSEDKTDSYRKKKVPFYEPFLEDKLKQHLGGRFIIADSLAGAVENSDYVFYCVGTPCRNDGSADLSILQNAILQTLEVTVKGRYKVLVIKSTVPPSTTSEKIGPLIRRNGFNVGEEIGLVNNPEFLREGYAWEDFIKPDRVVIGQYDEKSGALLEEIYKCFNAPICRVSLNTAEFVKYVSNALLAAMISFSNEMSMIAEAVSDIDVAETFKILHQDKRWLGTPAPMSSYVYPGCGFGGYCLPKDGRALYSLSKTRGYEPMLLKSVLQVNELIKDFVVDKVKRNVSSEQTIGILGLSFKPNSDDIRHTPAGFIIEKLLKCGFKKIIAYDPVANDVFRTVCDGEIEYADTMEDLLGKADNIAILTAWPEFKEKKELLKGKNVFDFRYMMV